MHILIDIKKGSNDFESASKFITEQVILKRLEFLNE